MRRLPPHILVTTPESLYILLTSDAGRAHAEVGEDGDRRRTARGRRQQARRAPDADAGAARGAVRAAAGAHRPVGDGEAAGWDGALPDRPAAGRGDDHRRRPHPRARPGAGGAAFAARCGDGHRGLGRDVRPAHRAHPPAPHHADLRQPAAHRRTRRATPGRTHRRGTRHRAPRQPGARTPARRRAAAEVRRAEGAGRDQLAGTGHRHRRHRPGLPDRFAAGAECAAAARRPCRPRGRRDPEGAAVSAGAGRPARMHGVARRGAARRTRPHPCAGQAAGRARAADRRRSRLPRVAAAASCTNAAASHTRTATWAWPSSSESCRCSPTATARAAAGAARTCTTTRSIARCAHAAARSWRR